MTLLETRQIILRDMAREINDCYLGLLKYIENGFITIGKAALIRAKIEEFESVTSYIRSEFEAINRDIINETVREVEKIWVNSGEINYKNAEIESI